MGEIEFTGQGDSVQVLCDYGPPIFNYTWYFAGLNSVTLRDLQFESCPRPLRLDTIAEVEIKDCSFRLVNFNIKQTFEPSETFNRVFYNYIHVYVDR